MAADLSQLLCCNMGGATVEVRVRRGDLFVGSGTLFDSGPRAAVDVFIRGDVFADGDLVIEMCDGLLRPRRLEFHRWRRRWATDRYIGKEKNDCYYGLL